LENVGISKKGWGPSQKKGCEHPGQERQTGVNQKFDAEPE
jgi:hypothetical protein